MLKTVIEPFVIKVIEPIRFTTIAERQQLVAEAHYNLFALRADDVIIDLLTDSGTSAMSAEQWGALQRGDESYAGSASFYRFEQAVRELMPFRYILPTHQGRAAEKIMCELLVKPEHIIPNNTHFDTTRANIEKSGALAIDLPCSESQDNESSYPFKGNMDIASLTQLLEDKHQQIPLVIITITNNANGGQPVSMHNMELVRSLCDQYQKPLFIDACRFAENAYFIQRREAGFADKDIVSIVNQIFSLADGVTMSGKKDALANIGGWLAFNNESWLEDARNQLILTEGFPTYGGLSGRSLEAMAVGLHEIVDEYYLHYRCQTLAYIGEAFKSIGIPIVNPTGGHAVFIDARKLLPHIPPLHYPAQALAVALYVVGGIRSVEIGSVMFGQQVDGSEKPAKQELLRLALPRRVYTQSHADYLVEAMEKVFSYKDQLSGYEITKQPRRLRHFTAQFKPYQPLPKFKDSV